MRLRLLTDDCFGRTPSLDHVIAERLLTEKAGLQVISYRQAAADPNQPVERIRISMNCRLIIAVPFALFACTSCAADPVDDLKEQFSEYRKAQIEAADSPEVPDDVRVRLKFQEMLWSFGEENSITSYELSSLMGEWAIDGEKWGKGGVGILGHDLYVVLEGQRNVVILSDDREWEGKSSDETEIVFVNNHREIVDESSFDYNDGVMIIFRLDEIRFIDFSTNTGGRYRRAREPRDHE